MHSSTLKYLENISISQQINELERIFILDI